MLPRPQTILQKNVLVPFISIPCSRASNASDIPCSKFITGGRIAHSWRRHGTVTDVNDARVSSPRCVCVICILHCPWRLHTGCRSETNYFHTQGNTPWTAWQWALICCFQQQNVPAFSLLGSTFFILKSRFLWSVIHQSKIPVKHQSAQWDDLEPI